jgi:Na+-translocating ferredoxin:NAD+ oxidoreductase RnfD subunit
MTARSVTLGGASYPVVLPNLRDPRLHVAAVIISVHVLGQVALGFRVSVPQILAAILACAILEVAITFRTARAFVWPASAMLTGSGVALILRDVGTRPHQPWSVDAWYLFAAVAGLSLLSKYVIKYRGSHVFNPSNIGLVVAFLVLGSSRVEPLDFWWAPLNLPTILAYGVIIVGGFLITRRLRLLGLAASFWLALSAGLGILAMSGHCMVANWAFAPVCGFDFWRVVVTSPEVMIFLFFMITDPKTVPAGQVGRIVFGLAVAATSTLLIAPQTDEFGAKVGLLAGLVIVCAARPLIDRAVPETGSAADDLRSFLRGSAERSAAPMRAVAGALAVVVAGVAIVAAGTPARGTVLPDGVEALNRPAPAVDPDTLPPITIDPEVIEFDHERAGVGMHEVVVALSQNLALESRALLERDEELLAAIDHGDRLDEMRARLDEAVATGTTTVQRYAFDAINVTLLVPFGQQTGLSLGLTGHGTAVTERYDAAGTLTDSETRSFELTFAMRQATGDRWMLVGVLPPAAP